MRAPRCSAGLMLLGRRVLNREEEHAPVQVLQCEGETGDCAAYSPQNRYKKVVVHDNREARL